MHSTSDCRLTPELAINLNKRIRGGEQNGHSYQTYSEPDLTLKDVININVEDSRANILEESGEPDLAQTNEPSKTAVRNKEDGEIKGLRQQQDGDNMKGGMSASCDAFMADNVKEINEKEAVAECISNLKRVDLGKPCVANNNSRGKAAKNERPFLNNFR